jgi:hypothetical protein
MLRGRRTVFGHKEKGEVGVRTQKMRGSRGSDPVDKGKERVRTPRIRGSGYECSKDIRGGGG